MLTRGVATPQTKIHHVLCGVPPNIKIVFEKDLFKHPKANFCLRKWHYNNSSRSSAIRVIDESLAIFYPCLIDNSRQELFGLVNVSAIF